MPKKRKDTLTTNKQLQNNENLNGQLDELLRLIEIVNEIPKKLPGLPKYRVISEGVRSKQHWRRFQPFGYFAELEPDLPDFLKDEYTLQSQNTNQTVLEEIKRITKDLPKFSNYLFGKNQDFYEEINKRYEDNIFGIFEKYDEMLSFTKNLIEIAIHCSIFIKKFGAKGYEQLELKDDLYLDMYVSAYCVKNGKFDFEPPLLLKLLQGLEPSRLRYCFACKRVFWASDLRMKRCSRRCTNAQNTKNWRSKPDNKIDFLTKKRERYKKDNPNSKAALEEKREREKKKKRQEWANQDFSKRD